MDDQPNIRNVVFDCNVLLQAMSRPEGASGACFQLVLDRKIFLQISPFIVKEFIRTATHPRVIKKLGLTHQRIIRFTDLLMTFAVNNGKVDDLCLLPRDPDDSNYLNLALITKASHLVTWDQDILESTQQSIVALVEGTSWGFEICTPVEFLNLIRN